MPWCHEEERIANESAQRARPEIRRPADESEHRDQERVADEAGAGPDGDAERSLHHAPARDFDQVQG